MISIEAALEKNDLKKIREIPKTDFHNHSLYGGNRIHLYHETGVLIPPVKKYITAVEDIDKHINNYTKNLELSNKEYYYLLLESAVEQACWDGIQQMVLNVDAWIIYHYFKGNASSLAMFLKKRLKGRKIKILIQVGISRFASIEEMETLLEPLWNNKEIYSIDLYGPEHMGNMDDFKMIYKKAKKSNWIRSAHIGEWSNSEAVMQYVTELDLQQINHGISIAYSEDAIKLVKDRHIIVHQCPTSNLFLKRVKCMKEHPIGILHRKGVIVTINSDDILVFDSDVSKEYLRLYQAQVCSAVELEEIRDRALRIL